MSDIDASRFLREGRDRGLIGEGAGGFSEAAYESALQEMYGAVASGSGRRGSAARQNLASAGDARFQSFMASDEYKALASGDDKQIRKLLRRKKDRQKLGQMMPEIAQFFGSTFWRTGGDPDDPLKDVKRKDFNEADFAAYVQAMANPNSALGAMALGNTQTTAPPEPAQQASAPQPSADDVNQAMADAPDPLPKPTDIADEYQEMDRLGSYRRV